MAILPTESTELDFQSALPLDACTFPEQVTTLCWAGYAGPTSLSYRVSAHHRHGIPQRSRAMLLSLTHQLGLTFCSTQEICRICKIAPYCSAPLPVTYSCMLKMANCYTGREYIQARLRAYKSGLLAWVRPVAKHISKSVHVKIHCGCLTTLQLRFACPSFSDCTRFEPRSET